MKKTLFKLQLLFFISCALLVSCKGKTSAPSKEAIAQIGLKRGKLVLCGVPEKHFGSVDFEISGEGKIKEDFNLAVALLHSFEYDEAEKAFAKIIDENPDCAMAYWGVAMCNYHPLWTPPTGFELEKGARAAAIARSITQKSIRETEYIDAISSFYTDWDKVDHHTRSVNFEHGMEKVHRDNPGDKEAAIFYALALDAAADPTDKTFRNQKKAASILFALYPGEPNHPGVAHYIIHTYDYPGLATLALPMARRYASIAPSSAHALHMPSHIFTRLGLWDESINSNLASISSAQCYAPAAGIKGHWDEELHGMDYLVYAYLQKGENKLAKAQWDYLNNITDVYPVNFKVAYAFAAIPSRYVLENKLWAEAAKLELKPKKIPWRNFPWQAAIVHFTRLMGNVHLNNLDSAKVELAKLNVLCDTLVKQKDTYKANQVKIQITASEAWIAFYKRNNDEALRLMNLAANMEDQTEKHPVTPCEVIPARELLGDMLLQMNKPEQALQAYEADLKTHPNRLNGTKGAALAAERSGEIKKTDYYHLQLLNLASGGSGRPELAAIRQPY
ncbi:hypothetical protein GSY63_17865 [Mucilaginibacter sp. R11]|uniref:Tetratricopeptide repeat protein n=2 Tax=Mucilaginibacter agri TaxID=2695265 RepID=A0A965ZHL5_9SPHI|nr:hypothetical protein [Mucilaginibacter agri]